jgi:hypothetical protein
MVDTGPAGREFTQSIEEAEEVMAPRYHLLWIVEAEGIVKDIVQVLLVFRGMYARGVPGNGQHLVCLQITLLDRLAT